MPVAWPTVSGFTRPYLPTTFLNTGVGSIYIESLYSVPGMGGLLVDVVKRQDNSMVQAIVILFASVGIIGLIVGDIMMTLLDPRISFAGRKGARCTYGNEI